MARLWRIAAGFALVHHVLAAGLVQPAGALSCSKDQLAAAVDAAGASLRKLNSEMGPRLKAKMQQLKEQRGWKDGEYEEKAYEALQDARVAELDAQLNERLAQIDAASTASLETEEDCAKVKDLAAASAELQATMRAKNAYMLAKLDALIGSGAPGPKAVPEPAPKAAPEAKPKAATTAPPPKTATAPPQSQPPTPAPKQAVPPWATTTTDPDGTKVGAATPAPPPGSIGPPPALPPAAPAEDGYTIDEIQGVSAGFFGKVSSGLGSVVEHAFRKTGRPAGYVLGTEGGGAFLAGLRYGSGTLYLRSGGTRKVYWHGPSLGYDFGADGSKTMFLIYRLDDPEELFSRFTGVDGSAYLVGGVGLTYVTNGRIMMAPIRSGLGLRLGANIGFIRFTPRPTWNPF